eukprot:TRINITY_DN64626_c0_g1_i1.p1 TRINITY_DN64626_c0_g1~~TRINITY_DN64626_c0_g1_i1.p1  ORF type:complete len:875 (-),score=146.94 TRINITY_DN64626_c0_g1_i1:77-2563(-)
MSSPVPTRLSAQASKRLPSLVKELDHARQQCEPIIEHDQTWPAFCEQAKLPSFWAPLRVDVGPSGPVLELLYEATCGLLFTVGQVQKEKGASVDNLLARLDCDLQAAAAVIVRLMRPELFTTPSPKFLHETRLIKIPVLGACPEVVQSCCLRLNMFYHSSWRFSATNFFTAFKGDVHVDSFPVALPSHLRTASCFYLDVAMASCKRMQVQSLGDHSSAFSFVSIVDQAGAEAACSKATLEVGAGIYIEWFFAWFFKELRARAGACPLAMLNLYHNSFLGNACEGYDEAWLLGAMEDGRDVMVMHKFLGLSHPERPFAVGAQPVVIDSPELFNEILHAVEMQGHSVKHQGGSAGGSAFVPFSFPPALCDGDRNLQRAHCCLALGSAEGRTMVVEATASFAQELLGESIDQLLALDRAEMDSMLENVDRLVRDALEALQKMQVSRRESQSAAQYVIDALVSDAWHQIRCRHEWRAVEARVNAWGQERRRSTKTVKRKSKQRTSTLAQTSPSMSTVVKELQARTEMYRHTASCVASLVGADVLQIGQIQSEQPLELWDSCTDTGSGYFDLAPNLTVDIRAPRAPISTGAAVSSMEVRNRRKKHFQAVLEASAAEDRQLALSHVEENQLKLAIQMSIHNCHGAERMDADEVEDSACLPARLTEGSAVAVNQPGPDAEFRQEVVLLKFLRPSGALRDALLSAPKLAECKALLERHSYTAELESGAKVFVSPDHFTPLMEAIRMGKWQLYPEHVFVDPGLEEVVLGVARGLPRSAKVYCHKAGLKRYSVPTGFAAEVSGLDDPDISVEYQRSFVHVRLPSSLVSNRSYAGPATV